VESRLEARGLANGPPLADRHFGSKQRKVETHALDELTPNPELDGKAPHVPGGDDRSFEHAQRHALHADGTVGEREFVLPLLLEREWLRVGHLVRERWGSGLCRRG
jgi:hypothetical protein